jgi:hypothetical protein
LLNPNSGYELHMRGVFSQPAVSHFTYQTAVFKLNLHTGAGREIARTEETQTAFRNIQHAPGFLIYVNAAGSVNLNSEIGGQASVPALFKPAH